MRERCGEGGVGGRDACACQQDEKTFTPCSLPSCRRVEIHHQHPPLPSPSPPPLSIPGEWGFNDFLRRGLIEYLDVNEENVSLIALYETHCTRCGTGGGAYVPHQCGRMRVSGCT